MRILTVLTYYYPHWTGLTAHAVHAAEELVARGHQVTVLTSRHTSELEPEEWRRGVRIVRLQPVGRFSRGVITPSFPIHARRLIAAHDLVHIHTPLPEAVLVGALCRAMGRPMVMTHHGDVVMPAGAVNRFVERSAYWLLRTAGHLADAVTVYSRDYAEHSPLLRHFLHKIAPIFPPVEIPSPDPAGMAAWRETLGLAEKTIIGFAGRWVEEKGFDYLLEALPRIREAMPRVHLAYAGEKNVIYDNFYRRCEPLVEAQREHISLLGLIRDPQRLANFYGMCDLIAVPSRTDNMPLVEIEALLCGTPLVVSDIPGARVVVWETGFGRLAPPNDAVGLARIIVDTLRERERYVPNLATVRRVFSKERSIEQYEQLMLRLVDRRRIAPAAPAAPAVAAGPASAASATSAASTASADRQVRTHGD